MTSSQSGDNSTISRPFSRTSKEEEKQRTREGQSTKDDKNDDSNNSDKHTVDNEEDSRKEEIVKAKDASEHKTTEGDINDDNDTAKTNKTNNNNNNNSFMDEDLLDPVVIYDKIHNIVVGQLNDDTHLIMV